MNEDRQSQERKSDLLRRKRAFEQLQRERNFTQQAKERVDGSVPAKRGFHLFQRKQKNNFPKDEVRPSPFANQNLQIKPEKRSKKRFRLSWRLLSGLLTILFSTLLITAWCSPNFQVSDIEITGNQRISQDEIIKQLTLMNKPLFTIQTEEVAQTIFNAFPEFKDVQVALNLPNQIIITVSERTPYIAWQLEKQTLWIDADGMLFPARGQASPSITVHSNSYPGFNNAQPIDQPDIQMDKYHLKLDNWKFPPDSVTWFSYYQKIDPGLLLAINKLNIQIPDQKDLLYDASRGLGWTDSHGWKIFVGFDLERINEKWLMITEISSELVKKGITPSLISVEYLHAPYFRVD